MSIVNVNDCDVPPPGAGVSTFICAVPLDAMSAAAIDACNCAALTNVVGRAAPFHCTVEEEVKPLPLAVSVNGPPPENTWVGDSEVTTGSGFKDPSTKTAGLVAARTLLMNSLNS